jgi:hypothetical protein
VDVVRANTTFFTSDEIEQVFFFSKRINEEINTKVHGHTWQQFAYTWSLKDQLFTIAGLHHRPCFNQGF